MPNLLKLVTPHGDGWNARQSDPIIVHFEVHTLLAAVAELQASHQVLLNRINKCKDC